MTMRGAHVAELRSVAQAIVTARLEGDRTTAADLVLSVDPLELAIVLADLAAMVHTYHCRVELGGRLGVDGDDVPSSLVVPYRSEAWRTMMLSLAEWEASHG